MNPASYYHSPPKPVSTRARCPVCQQAVYSLAGIHPQCAERQADPPRPKAKPRRLRPRSISQLKRYTDAGVTPPVAAISLVPGRGAETVHIEVSRSRKKASVRSRAILVG